MLQKVCVMHSITVVRHEAHQCGCLNQIRDVDHEHDHHYCGICQIEWITPVKR